MPATSASAQVRKAVTRNVSADNRLEDIADPPRVTGPPAWGRAETELLACGTTVFWGSEDGREYGGESGSGATMKGYQPRGTSYLSPWCRTN